VRRTCVGRDSGASGSRQLLRDLDRLPQGTKDVFLVATSGADSRLHFEIKFGLSALHVVCGIIALQHIWGCLGNAPVSQPPRVKQFCRLVFYKNGAPFPAPRQKSDGIEVHEDMFYSYTWLHEIFENPALTKYGISLNTAKWHVNLHLCNLFIRGLWLESCLSSDSCPEALKKYQRHISRSVASTSPCTSGVVMSARKCIQSGSSRMRSIFKWLKQFRQFCSNIP